MTPRAESCPISLDLGRAHRLAGEAGRGLARMMSKARPRDFVM